MGNVENYLDFDFKTFIEPSLSAAIEKNRLKMVTEDNFTLDMLLELSKLLHKRDEVRVSEVQDDIH